MSVYVQPPDGGEWEHIGVVTAAEWWEAATERRLRERFGDVRWTIYVCAEEDGEHCQSGTHRNILRHQCAAIARFHRGEGEGPRIATIEVGPVG